MERFFVETAASKPATHNLYQKTTKNKQQKQFQKTTQTAKKTEVTNKTVAAIPVAIIKDSCDNSSNNNSNSRNCSQPPTVTATLQKCSPGNDKSD